jgi:anti-sigma-K factor RskA
MNAASDHLHWEDAVGAYLLEALPEEEARGFEVHLDGCLACREELARLRIAADALPVSAPPVPPPPELKARIMSVVRSEAELLSAAGADADTPARPRRRRRVWPLWPNLVLARPVVAWAAAAVLVVVGGVVGFAVRGGGTDTRTLAAQVTAPGAHATLRTVGDAAQLEVRGLPAPAGDRVYEVWRLEAGKTKPEPTDALFTIRSGGTASVAVPGGVRGVDKVMVTAEPPGGSAAPTTGPVLVVDTA